MPCPVFADTSEKIASPPSSSGITSWLNSSPFTFSEFASGLSILLIATIIGTSAALEWLIASIVWGITPSSAATAKITISVAFAPLALIAEKASCPGVSKKVIIPLGVSTWYAPICWVIPPASPDATLDVLIKSKSEVLPWSTWPITVTTGGLNSNIGSVTSSIFNNDSGSFSFAASGLWPISSTAIIAVSWSSTWLIVTIIPIPIKIFITSPAFTDILWARSATDIVSGTKISLAIISVGTTKFASESSFLFLFLDLGERQPPEPISCLGLVVLFFIVRSTHTSFFSFFSFSIFTPILDAGLWSVLSVLTSFFDLSEEVFFLFFASAACASASAECLLASSSRMFFWLSSITGKGLSEESNFFSFSSADFISWGLRRVLFFLTSTWMVLALPSLSVFLISVFCFRVNVIFAFGFWLPPCTFLKYFSNADLSSSETSSIELALVTPAPFNCSSKRLTGRPNSLANFSTVNVSIKTPNIYLSKPWCTRSHN